MPNNYIQQTSTFGAVLPGVVPEKQQQQNQFSSINTDLTNVFNAVNGLLGNGSTGYSWFQTQNIITPLRVYGTPYQNTNGKTMFVTVTSNISSTSSVTVLSDTTLSPVIQIAKTDVASGNSPISFMILNNYYYVLNTTGTVSLVEWTEWS